MSDQFFIPVQNQVAPALRGLASTVQQVGEISRERDQQAKMQEAQEEYQQALTQFDTAMQNKDYDTINRLSLQYPQVGEFALKSLGAQSEKTLDNAKQTLAQLYSNPGNFEQILGDREQLVTSEGGNPIDTTWLKELYRLAPDEANDFVRSTFALVGGDDYERVKKELDDAPTYSNIKKEPDGSYVGFNKKSGQIEVIPGDYQRQATAKPKKLKEVKGGVKYYEDGSEEPIGQSEQVSNPVTGKRLTPQQAQAVLADAKEFQLKNGGFAVTLDSGLQTIDRMYDEGYDPTKAAWISSAFGEGTLPTNLLTTEEDQVFSGAIDQMINAIARRETGAEITEFERKDFFNRYMPKAGDSKKRIRQKRDSLERQLKSIAGQSAGVFEALKITGDDSSYGVTEGSSLNEDSGQPQVKSFTSSGGIQFTVK